MLIVTLLCITTYLSLALIHIHTKPPLTCIGTPYNHSSTLISIHTSHSNSSQLTSIQYLIHSCPYNSTRLLHLLDPPQPRPCIRLPLGKPYLPRQRRSLLVLLPRLGSPALHFKELAQVMRRHRAPNVALFIALVARYRRRVRQRFRRPLPRLFNQNCPRRCARHGERRRGWRERWC